MGSNSVQNLRSSIKGSVVLPEDGNYDEVREIWNAMIDRRPALIVQCGSVDDVPAAITYASDNNLELCIRGAGHNIAGNSLCDGGLLIDFSQMKKVRVDADKRRAYVEPGATLGDFDAAAQAHGLATPVGINSTTGIAGLTLGGGFGWLSRKYGLTIDNLVSADVVLADGKKVTASEAENADLFWAVRGGGGNFGVVTQFEFQLHPVGPEILAGLLVFPLAQAMAVLKKYREFVLSTPEEFAAWAVLRLAPPLPFLDESVHGKPVLVLPVFHAGDHAEGEKLIDTLRGFGELHGEHVGPMPYVQWQQAFDPLLTPGARNYWKSHNFTELKDEALQQLVDYAGKLPSSHCEIFIGQINGAPNRVAQDATAYASRDALYVMNVHGRWESVPEDDSCIAWCRDFFKATAPYATGSIYVNFMTEDEGERLPAAYGDNMARLQEIKQKYDPENVFHVNHNIKVTS